jgi:hypothetical protein
MEWEKAKQKKEIKRKKIKAKEETTISRWILVCFTTPSGSRLYSIESNNSLGSIGKDASVA